MSDISVEIKKNVNNNRTLNYQPETVFTGIATGKVQDGKYEVKTILG